MGDWIDNIQCDFAILDITKYRRRIAATLKRGEPIKFTLTGTLQAHPSAIGNNDGVSIEFWADIHSSHFEGDQDA